MTCPRYGRPWRPPPRTTRSTRRPSFRPARLAVGCGFRFLAPTHRCVRALPHARRLRLLRVRQGLTLSFPAWGGGSFGWRHGGEEAAPWKVQGPEMAVFEFCFVKRRRMDSALGGRSSVAACIARSEARTLQYDRHDPQTGGENPDLGPQTEGTQHRRDKGVILEHQV